MNNRFNLRVVCLIVVSSALICCRAAIASTWVAGGPADFPDPSSWNGGVPAGKNSEAVFGQTGSSAQVLVPARSTIVLGNLVVAQSNSDFLFGDYSYVSANTITVSTIPSTTAWWSMRGTNYQIAANNLVIAENSFYQGGVSLAGDGRLNVGNLLVGSNNSFGECLIWNECGMNAGSILIGWGNIQISNFATISVAEDYQQDRGSLTIGDGAKLVASSLDFGDQTNILLRDGAVLQSYSDLVAGSITEMLTSRSYAPTIDVFGDCNVGLLSVQLSPGLALQPGDKFSIAKSNGQLPADVALPSLGSADKQWTIARENGVLTISVVPEPASGLLILTGAMVLVVVRSCRNQI